MSDVGRKWDIKRRAGLLTPKSKHLLMERQGKR